MAITRQMLFPLAFYKKSKFNGSKGKMCYRIEKIEDVIKEAEVVDGVEVKVVTETKFLLSIWEGPECYDAAKGEKMTSKYPFSDAGMEEIMKVLNQM